ncbi:MAG: hypothetical protein ACPL4H_03710 [Anaerolineales bacterium]
MDTRIRAGVRVVFSDLEQFSTQLGGRKLRSYQIRVAAAILDSVLHQRGREFVVIFPRQSGKNELQAHLEAYLLSLLQAYPAEMIKVSPTWKPQTLYAMRRLERVLQRNLLTRHHFVKESGHIYRIGQARLTFLSGAPTSNVVGATANVLLECDEAQDILVEKWERDFAPMAASTNATRVFYGTAWTADTLLGRVWRLAQQAEEEDGIQRVYLLTADEVAQEVPAYGRYVAEQVLRFGRHHPMVRSQYYSEEIAGNGGMFTSERLQLMRGSHLAQTKPQQDGVYAFCLDVGGYSIPSVFNNRAPLMDERALSPSSAVSIASDMVAVDQEQDASALTIFQLEAGFLPPPGELGGTNPLLTATIYRVVWRMVWQGVSQSQLFSQIVALAECWQPRTIIVDATGIGAGLAEHLQLHLGKRVLPFIFSRASKSKLGWDFLAIIESGRYKEYLSEDEQLIRLQECFFRQAQYCQMEISPGFDRQLRWGVPNHSRDPITHRLLHDDLLISAALCAVLEGQSFGNATSTVVTPNDPLRSYREVI